MDSPQTAGVVAPPPLIFLGCFLGGLALDGLTDFPGLRLAWPLRDALALLLIGGGAWTLAAARRAFGAAGTPIAPWDPTTALVATGPYRRSRNPIYLAMSAVAAGLALALDAIFGLFATAGALAIVRYGVVAREEAYLGARFGEPYRRYRATVRRWL